MPMAKTQKQNSKKGKSTRATTASKSAVRTKTASKPKRKVASSGPVVRERSSGPIAAIVPSRGKLERVKMPAASQRLRSEKESTPEDANEGKYVYCIIK